MANKETFIGEAPIESTPRTPFKFKLKARSVGAENLKDKSVTANKIADNAVGNRQLAANSVESSNIVGGAVTTDQLADNSITTAKIQNNAVIENKIGAEAVTTEKIASNAVTGSKISDGSITETKLGTGAVTTNKIVDNAITENKIGTGAVTEGKIGNSAVTNTKIANNAVTTDKIQDGAVTTDKLAPQAIQQITDLETQFQGNETTRQNNETTRIENETGRVSAESGRVGAETSRVSAETSRDTAETTRQSNETTRQSNETTRENNETTRQSNETQRQTNETNRTATASADHNTAVSDHNQAANDHTTAASDHSVAEEDHTQAVTDHNTAASDHTTATTDHTRAESDHTNIINAIASADLVFDISLAHASGGVLAQYADLAAALGTDGVNVPSENRHGGMTVKFVQSSDNKYVQYRLMADDFSTTVSDWQGVDEEPVAGSKNLITSGGVADSIKELTGYDGKLYPINIVDGRLQNNSTSNYGYWYGTTEKSLVFDLSSAKGKSISINTYTIYNSYTWCIVSDYLAIPSSYNPTIFDPLVLLSGNKTWNSTSYTFTANVPNTNGGCYLILSVSASHINDVSVICSENAIESFSAFKESFSTFEESVNTFMGEHTDDIKKEDISLTGTNYLGVMPAQTHRIASANVGSELVFGGGSGYQSSHEYLPVQEGEIYYLMYGRDNTIHAAITDDNNIVVAAYTESIYYAGLIRVEIPQGGKFLTWTTDGGSTLGWYVKVVDKKYDNYLLYEGEVKHYTPTEIQTVSTDVVCTQSKHLVNGINMIDCEMNGTTSKIVIPVDYTKECKKGFYLYIDPSQISKIAGVAVNGLNLSVYSTFSYQDCFYLSVPINASTSKIEISLTLAEGVTDDVIVAISSQMDVNKINKAVVCVNFDSTWQSSVDSGAYDYIFGTAKLPVTITGTVDMSIYDFKSLLANGMLEIGTYGGNQGFEQQCSHITEGCSMSVLNQHLDVKEDYYQDTFKIQPHTFGGRQHQIDRKIIFALKKNGYHSSRMRDYNIYGGANYGGVIINDFNIVSRIHEISSNGGVYEALLHQAAITFFAHGLSTDGTGDAETKWSTFKSKIDYAMQNVNNGGMLAMTFEQYYQTLKRFGLVANVC